ncbi:hypothetical protein Hanom_Chr16g01466051 [Helianthus anomalus]
MRGIFIPTNHIFLCFFKNFFYHSPRGVNEPGGARARLDSSSAHHVFLKLELGSVQAYLFELELGSRVKPKDRARLDSDRAILRTTLEELKTRLELASISLK